MTMMQRLANWGEALPVPDSLTRLAIATLVGRTRAHLDGQPADDAFFAQNMAHFPIAQHTDAANAQQIGRAHV